jgi:hypothetical protein
MRMDGEFGSSWRDVQVPAADRPMPGAYSLQNFTFHLGISILPLLYLPGDIPSRMGCAWTVGRKKCHRAERG